MRELFVIIEGFAGFLGWLALSALFMGVMYTLYEVVVGYFIKKISKRVKEAESKADMAQRNCMRFIEVISFVNRIDFEKAKELYYKVQRGEI